jgi:hypothetical protein
MQVFMSPGCDRLELVAQTPEENSLLELIRRRFSTATDPAWPGPRPSNPEEWLRWIREQRRCGRNPDILGRIVNI